MTDTSDRRKMQTGSSAPAIAQSIITLIAAIFFAYVIYVYLTEDGIRNYFVAVYWGKIAEQTLATLVISTVASVGLWRLWRWAWFLALALDLVVLAKCIYEVAWEDWDLWGNGREFTNTEDAVIGLIFFGGIVVLLLPSVSRARLPRPKSLPTS